MSSKVHPDDLDPVEVPGASKCPYCGGEPTEQSQAEHSLSVLDYLHDDVALHCSDCSRKWTCGVPIGGPPPENFEDLWCDSCDRGFMLVHRVDIAHLEKRDDGTVEGRIGIHLKCPHHEEFACPNCGVDMTPGFTKGGVPYCPNCTMVMDRDDLEGHGCFHFDQTSRPVSDTGMANTFYPQITGDTERGQPYGSPEP